MSKAQPNPIGNKSASVIAVLRPSTGRMKFKLRISNYSSYISIYFNFNQNPIGGSRGIIKIGVLILDIYLDLYRSTTHFLDNPL